MIGLENPLHIALVLVVAPSALVQDADRAAGPDRTPTAA